MRILVVGGAGFLGANLARFCLESGDHEITVLDSLDPRLRSTTASLKDIWNRIEFVRGSVCDPDVISGLVQRRDVIFNCSGQTSHPLSLHDPLYDAEVNCLGNLQLLEAVRRYNRDAVVVYTSSSTVIGKAAGDIVDENHAERPLDVYSANKGVAEKYYRIYNRVHDLNTVVLRFANLYGPYGKGYPEFGFVNYFIHLAWNRKEIRLFGAGQQTRNVLYVEDAADIMYRAAQDSRLFGEVYFAAHEQHLSVSAIAHQIVDSFGRGSVVSVDWPEERRRIEIDAVRITSSRLRGITGWRPKHDFEKGLLKTRSFLEQRGEIPRGDA